MTAGDVMTLGISKLGRAEADACPVDEGYVGRLEQRR